MPLDEELREALNKLYLDPKTGFKGVNAFYKTAVEKIPSLSIKDVKEFLADQETYTTHKPVPRKWQHIIADAPQKYYAMDLVDYTNYKSKNGGLGWILGLIDIFSRKVYARALKTKSEADVLAGLKEIIDEEGLKPAQIVSDQGPEFTSRIMEKYLADSDIFHNTTRPYSPQSNAIIERFNRTLKSMIYKYFAATDGNEWAAELPEFLANYNGTVHSTLGMAPNDANKPENAAKLYTHIREKLFTPEIKNDKWFEPGQFVRIRLEKGKLDKKIKDTFSDTIYVIKQYFPGEPGLMWDSYKVANARTGSPVKKLYLYSDLIAAKEPAAESPKSERKEFEKDVKAARSLGIEFKESKEEALKKVQAVKELPRFEARKSSRERKAPDRYKG